MATPTSVDQRHADLSTTATIASPNGQYPIAIAVGTLSATELRLRHRRRHFDHRRHAGHHDHGDGQPRLDLDLRPGPHLHRRSSARPSAATRRPPAPSSSRSTAVPSAQPSHWSTARPRATLLSSPHAGSHTIEAIYSGDGIYATNSQAVTQTVSPAMLTITADNQTKVYGAALPTLTASYSGFVNGDTSDQPDHPAHAQHYRHRQQQGRGEPVRDHRLGSSRQRLHDHLCTRHPDRHPCGADNHGRQPDQGLRCRAADSHRVVFRLREWRHPEQPDHPAHC